MSKHTLIIFTILFLSSTVLFGQQTENEKAAAELYNDANKLGKSGQYEAALKKYDEALVLEQDPRFYFQKSKTLKKLRKFSEAEVTLKKSLEIDPNYIASYWGLGTNYFSLKKYDQAIVNFKKYIELSDNKKNINKMKVYVSRSYSKLGEEAYNNGSYLKAIEYFNNAVNYYNYDAAYLKLAKSYIELGEFDKGLEAADKAINYRTSKSKISKGAPYYYKGLAFKGKDEVDKAKENFQKSSKDKQYKVSSEYELKNLK